MSAKTSETPVTFVSSLLQKLGKEEGIPVELEPTWGYVGQITRIDGSKTYFRGTNFDLNGLGSTEIATDKGYAAYFLDKEGYRVIEGKTFYSPEFCDALKSNDNLEAAYQYAKEIGLPVVVKPNSLSQGRGVCVVNDKKGFLRAVRYICKSDRVFLVQRLIQGHDYRVVVLDGEVLSAYERLPLAVTGDGVSNIDQLLDLKQLEFEASKRDTVLKKDDFRITARLRRLGLSRKSVLPAGKKLALLDNRNLSTGGESVDVTSNIDPAFRKLCVKITQAMGLRYCGVDLMVDDDIQKPLSSQNNYVIIEINAAPGVDNYAKSGSAQMLIVAEMYRKILHALAKPLKT